MSTTTEPNEKELLEFVAENFPVYNFYVSEDAIEEGTHTVLHYFLPTWSTEKVQFKQFTDGITNKLFKVVAEDAHNRYSALLRIYGKQTEELIDREQEIRSMVWLSRYGLSSPVVGRFLNGMCYGYIAGTPFKPEDMISNSKWPLVARHLAYFHSASNAGPEVTPSLFQTFEKWHALLPESESKRAEVLREFKWLKKTLTKMIKKRNPVIAFCHNDLLSGNIVYRPSSLAMSPGCTKATLSLNTSFSITPRVGFIDVEYSSFNYTSFDIANHISEMMGYTVETAKFPPEDFIKKWVKKYLSHWKALKKLKAEGNFPSRAVEYEGEGVQVTDEEVNLLFEEIAPFTLAAHFLWGSWALVQASFSDTDFDYHDYANRLFRVYYERKKILFKK
eukprot:TRINITY_DN7613_c0_g1_i1.p1 TRINITY_DN7613_c0_g1~~TRINITY_DN7613_c0_g1_i1.p1  ORF type:complete len:390 (-),score=69.26 TRINITY_DN7613_c0_g1_i1:49-1218(-)